MITKLRVQNFKCLRDVTVELGPLTVLIGANDSGKSSLLDALHLLGRTTREPLTDVFQGASDVENLLWQRDKGASLHWEVRALGDAQDVDYAFELGADGSRAEALTVGVVSWIDLLSSRDSVHNLLVVQVPGQDNLVLPYDPNRTALASVVAALTNDARGRATAPLIASLRTLGRHHLSTDALRLPSVPAPGAVLSPSGDNLAAVVDAILGGPDREVRAAFEDALHAIIPTLKGVTTPPAAGGSPGAKEVHFVLAGTNGRRPVTIPGALASDGAMLVTAFLALAYGPTPDLLLVEEPENGLHPGRVGEIMALLRRMSTGEVGDRPRQIVVTTHNPLFLNQARPEEVRIVQRDTSAGTRVTPLAAVENIDEMLKDFGIGELWAMLGEKGLVEGASP